MACRCVVHVLSADGLRAADIGGRSDPYVICGVPGRMGSQMQTSFKTRTLAPVWNETLEISRSFRPGDSLEFIVMDHDYLTADDFLGWAQIVGGDLVPGLPFETRLDLSDDGRHGSNGQFCKGSLVVKVDVISDWLEPMEMSMDATDEAAGDKLVTRFVWSRIYDKLDSDRDASISRKEWCLGGGDTDLFDAIKRALGHKTIGNLLRKEWMALFDSLDAGDTFQVPSTRIKEWLLAESRSRSRLWTHHPQVSSDDEGDEDEEQDQEVEMKQPLVHDSPRGSA